jgi:fructose-specific phosphotransferase system IIA component
MRLTEILTPNNIKVPLTATTKVEAITELVNLLAENGDVSDRAKTLEAVLERESTRTTGIGSGVAIPHGKTTAANNLHLCVGRADKAIDFQSIDGKPVTLIWLLTSPPDKTGPHIHALARVSRLMTIDKFRHALANAKSAEEMYQVIVTQDAAL